MADVRIEKFTLPAASLGGANPLAAVADAADPPYEVTGGVPDEIKDGMAFGAVRNLYPYTMQDAYDRELRDREFVSVVLENEHLRARVLPELGGRIWSLRDLDRDVELLHDNSAVQYANFGLRDVWFAGGIEWNIGTRGHSPTTAIPLHTAFVDTVDGTVLRMWEFERLREAVFQVDLRLPAESEVLFAYVRIRNVSGSDAPMYWWTNAAVPLTDDTHVITSSSSAVATDYDGVIDTVDITPDLLTPTRAEYAADYFFDPVPGERPWEAVRDENGNGLTLMSTDLLSGRKLFCWGEGAGGHRWQDWLTPDGRRYAEIQSGLTRTQFEHALMPAGAGWDWVEAYGNIALQPGRAEAGRLQTGRAEAGRAEAGRAKAGRAEAASRQEANAAAARVEQLWPEAAISPVLEQGRAIADVRPGEPVVEGSGWGAVEQQLREREHRQPLQGKHIAVVDIASSGTSFDVVTDEVRPWKTLLDSDRLPDADAWEIDGSYVRGKAWETLLKNAPETWRTAAHLATMAHARGELDRAEAGYRKSIELTPNLPALRGRARLLAETGRTEQAADDYLAAVDGAGASTDVQPALVIEGAGLLLSGGEPARALQLIEDAADAVVLHGRVRLLQAQALHALGRDDEAGRILRDGLEVANLREGDQSLSQLWLAIFPDEPLPRDYDFRMKA